MNEAGSQPGIPLTNILSKESTKSLYFHSLASSLANLVVASVYSLLAIRLSLKYLGLEEYGLLSLITQVTAYISLLDLGLSVAFARILVDYSNGTKQHFANGLRTASLIFHTLGFLGFLAAILIALIGDGFLSIPHYLKKEFIILMVAQGAALFAIFSLKPLSAPLIAIGKIYIVYWINVVLMLLNTAILWLALSGGIGIYSAVIAQGVQIFLTAILLWKYSRPYRETGDTRGKLDRNIVREVFSFARDSMLWQIGGQTLGSLPIILASAWFALGGAADLSAGMKLVLLMVSVTTRFGAMSVPRLAIQFSNGNEQTAANQMIRIAGMSGGIGVFAAIFIVCANPSFISWWMLGKVSWTWDANVACAVWIALVSMGQCLYGYAVISKQMQVIRWAILGECVLFLLMAFSLRSSIGLPALLWAKPVAYALTAAYVAIRIKKRTLFDTSLLFPILIRQLIAMALFLPLCLILGAKLQAIIPHPLAAFLVTCALAACLALLAIPLIFTKEMRGDAIRLGTSAFSRFSRSKATENPLGQ